MKSPPRKKKGGPPRAASSTANRLTYLTQLLHAVKTSAPESWISEGWRLLREYRRTGQFKHLVALEYHIDGIIARTAGGMS